MVAVVPKLLRTPQLPVLQDEPALQHSVLVALRLRHLESPLPQPVLASVMLGNLVGQLRRTYSPQQRLLCQIAQPQCLVLGHLHISRPSLLLSSPHLPPLPLLPHPQCLHPSSLLQCNSHQPPTPLYQLNRIQPLRLPAITQSSKPNQRTISNAKTFGYFFDLSQKQREYLTAMATFRKTTMFQHRAHPHHTWAVVSASKYWCSFYASSI